jgi:hypothetical protein
MYALHVKPWTYTQSWRTVEEICGIEQNCLWHAAAEVEMLGPGAPRPSIQLTDGAQCHGLALAASLNIKLHAADPQRCAGSVCTTQERQTAEEPHKDAVMLCRRRVCQQPINAGSEFRNH